MRPYQPEQQRRQTHDRQQIERAVEYLMLGMLGTVFTLYAHKIEGLLLGSQGLVSALSLSAGLLAAACHYRGRMIEAASWHTVRLRQIEFRVRRDALAACYPLWWDLATSEDASQADVLDAVKTLDIIGNTPGNTGAISAFRQAARR